MAEVVKKPNCSAAGQKLMNMVDMIGKPHWNVLIIVGLTAAVEPNSPPA